MNKLYSLFFVPLFLASLMLTNCSQPERWETVASENFSSLEPGPPPEKLFFILDGKFSVTPLSKTPNHQALTLSGTPLGDFGVLFGPRVKESASIQADILAPAAGRRKSAFAVGLGGRGGYRLVITPAAKRMELFYETESLMQSQCKWDSSAWGFVSLTVTPRASMNTEPPQWQVKGIVTQEGQPPYELTYIEKEKPPIGKASLWGYTYAGKPIHFDKLVVKRPKETTK